MSETLERDTIDIAQRPLAHLLGYGEDVAVNEPGVAWHYLDGRWQRHEIPALTESRCRGIAILASAQGQPAERLAITSTDMPTGHRLEALLPPAVLRGTVGLCYRRSDDHVSPMEAVRSRFDVSRWNRFGTRKERQAAEAGELLALYDAGDIEGFMAAFAQRRLTPLFCGSTGAGKTYMLKSYLLLLDQLARVIVIEDAKEAVLRQANHVRLIFQKGGITPSQLLATSLRLRPDFVPLQELRDGDAAWVYLNECMAGHPGSPTTIHGSTAAEAARRLFNMIKGSPEGRGMDAETVRNMMATAIDMIVPIENVKGVRAIGEIWFAPEAARRGQTLHDLLREG